MIGTFGLIVSALLPAAEPATLAARLKPLAESHKGKVSIALKRLDSEESFRLDADRPMPTASLIKFPVMVEAYRQAAEKKLDLAAPVTLRAEDKVPGSGILTAHFSSGATFPLVDAVHLMIVYSDNTATNLVLDKIGLPATAATMEKLGFPHTKVHSKVFKRETSVFPERSKEFGLGSTTADDMVKLLDLMHRGELVDNASSEAMRKHLLACDDKNKFPKLLPAGTKIAFKTGSVDAVRTAAGILYCPAGPVALCVLTAENEDKSWTNSNAGDLLCAKVALEVFRHFGGKESGKPGAKAAAKK